MPIDFHAAANRYTYAGRRVDASWHEAIGAILDPSGLDVVDVGCGGGAYAHAWLDLGAASVTGVDFSAEMLAAAREGAGERPGLSFARGRAEATGLPDAVADVVFERALLHHVDDLDAATREARRLLRAGGIYVVQDRVADDVRQPGSERHPRGFFFERFPRLLDVELRRRPGAAALAAHMCAAGLCDVAARTVWEVRAVHPDREAYLEEEIRSRTGRSILHELDDAELDALVDHLRERLPAGEPITEADRWTIWTGRA